MTHKIELNFFLLYIVSKEGTWCNSRHWQLVAAARKLMKTPNHSRIWFSNASLLNASVLFLPSLFNILCLYLKVPVRSKCPLTLDQRGNFKLVYNMILSMSTEGDKVAAGLPAGSHFLWHLRLDSKKLLLPWLHDYVFPMGSNRIQIMVKAFDFAGLDRFIANLMRGEFISHVPPKRLSSDNATTMTSKPNRLGSHGWLWVLLPSWNTFVGVYNYLTLLWSECPMVHW